MCMLESTEDCVLVPSRVEHDAGSTVLRDPSWNVKARDREL